MTGPNEAARLEGLWAGDFGDEYVERNIDAAAGRDPFWRDLLGRLEARSALEVGCNVGGNLVWLAELLGAENVAAVDVNEKALEIARKRVPGVDARHVKARELPFADATFDLTFTTGVLIHQPDDALRDVMSEIVRCSGRYVLCGEYFAEEDVEVPYRDQPGALFKRDFGRYYREWFPELSEIDRGFLAAADGPWDDLTYWVFEKR